MADATLIDGKAFAAGLRARVAARVAALKKGANLVPGLATVLVGEDPASQSYVRSKIRETEAAGMISVHRTLPDDTRQRELIEVVRELNADPAVNGILVQLPLPSQIDPDQVIDAIDPAKDVDGFHPVNAGLLSAGRPGLVPCTPAGSLMLLKHHLGDLSGRHAVIVGRSNIVGKPMAQLLLAENCTVTICHSRTRELPAMCRQADILVAAIGRPRMIQGDWIKEGAAVIDVGINRIRREDGTSRLVGDVDFDAARTRAGWITPVPGGVGPMTIACLLSNTVLAACLQRGIPVPDVA